MTIDENCEKNGVFEVNRAPQAVKIGILALFYGLAVATTPFDSGI
jgi:hypothetical protein